MSRRVDALFEGEHDPFAPHIRARRSRTLVWVGVPLIVLSVPLWTGVFGTVLILAAWLLSEPPPPEAPLPQPEASSLQQTHRVASWALVLAVLTLVGQAWLLTTDFYDRLWPNLF